MSPDSFVTFTWSTDYSFYWFGTGVLSSGVVPTSGGYVAADLSSTNATTFNIEDNTPEFSEPTAGGPTGVFSIMGGPDIPNLVFSTGIGMSGFATFMKQAYINVNQEFNPDGAAYWIGASTALIQTTEILTQGSVSNTATFQFSPNTFQLTATLGEDNQWSIA